LPEERAELWSVSIPQRTDPPLAWLYSLAKKPPVFEREEDVAFYPGLKMKKIEYDWNEALITL